jgi:hypothetical protein
VKNLVSIDPGKSGAAVFWERGQPVEFVQFGELVETKKDFCLAILECEPEVAVLEDVIPMNTVSNSKLLWNKGWWHGLCDGLCLDVELVSPLKWTKPWRKPGLSYSQRKTRWRKIAKGLYPDNRVIAETADALLIGHYYLHYHKQNAIRYGNH